MNEVPTVEKSIEVDAPRERVFDLWTSFESFPRWMENVEEVRRTGPDLTHWRVKAAGQDVEWDATTTVERQDRVAWKARGEAGQSGVVTFDALGPGRTRVNVRIDYKLESGLKEGAAKALGIDDRIVSKNLDNFKEIAEGRGA